MTRTPVEPGAAISASITLGGTLRGSGPYLPHHPPNSGVPGSKPAARARAKARLSSSAMTCGVWEASCHLQERDARRGQALDGLLDLPRHDERDHPFSEPKDLSPFQPFGVYV